MDEVFYSVHLYFSVCPLTSQDSCRLRV